METMEILNKQIDKLLRDYELLRLENENLKEKLNESTKKNDELINYSKDMLSKIDNALNYAKVESERDESEERDNSLHQ